MSLLPPCLWSWSWSHLQIFYKVYKNTLKNSGVWDPSTFRPFDNEKHIRMATDSMWGQSDRNIRAKWSNSPSLILLLHVFELKGDLSGLGRFNGLKHAGLSPNSQHRQWNTFRDLSVFPGLLCKCEESSCNPRFTQPLAGYYSDVRCVCHLVYLCGRHTERWSLENGSKDKHCPVLLLNVDTHELILLHHERLGNNGKMTLQILNVITSGVTHTLVLLCAQHL